MCAESLRLASSASDPSPPSLHAGAPVSNSTFFCDTNATRCFSLLPAQTLQQHAASCYPLGYIWVPGSFDEQAAVELRLGLNATTHYIGINRTAPGDWEMVGNGTVLSSPQTLSVNGTNPYRFWWHTAEAAWAANSSLSCAAAVHTQRWCKYYGDEAVAADRANASLFATGCCDVAHGWSPVDCVTSRRAVCVVPMLNMPCW
jgi:hypothetical protein